MCLTRWLGYVWMGVTEALVVKPGRTCHGHPTPERPQRTKTYLATLGCCQGDIIAIRHEHYVGHCDLGKPVAEGSSLCCHCDAMQLAKSSVAPAGQLGLQALRRLLFLLTRRQFWYVLDPEALWPRSQPKGSVHEPRRFSAARARALWLFSITDLSSLSVEYQSINANGNPGCYADTVWVTCVRYTKEPSPVHDLKRQPHPWLRSL